MADRAARQVRSTPHGTDASVAGSAVLRTEVRDSLRGVETAWDGLVDRSPLPSPFLRSWWLEAVAGHRPSFVLFFCDRQLVGGIALERGRVLGVERLRAVGFELGADHVDLVADSPHAGMVVRALRAWFTRPGARIIDLVGLTEGARIIDALPSPVRHEVFDAAPWSPLPPGCLDDYFELRPRLRHLVDRPRRRLERLGAECRVVDTGDARPAVDRLRRLHEATWGRRSLFLPYFGRFARAAQEGIARRELVIHELWVDGDVIATDVGFEVAGRLSNYQGGRDADRRWRGAGTWLMALAIGEACGRGCRELDLLRGTEPYKQHWASEQRLLVHATAAHGRRARLVESLLPAARRARNAMKRVRGVRREQAPS